MEKDGVLYALYTYDAGGRRVRSWDTVDGTTDYVYSGLNVIDEVCGGVHERHVYAGGLHIASNTTGTNAVNPPRYGKNYITLIKV